MLQFPQFPDSVKKLKKRIREELRILKQPVVELGGIQIPMGYHLSQVMRDALYIGYYEQPELKLIKSQLEPSDIVMEVGAGLGLISSYCAKHIGSEKVFAYEANPALEGPIRQAYKLNQVNPDLKICVIGEKSGRTTFYIEKNCWSSSVIKRSPDAVPIKVPVKSFNEEIRRINPTFLIIDIEGGEYDLVKYADFYQVSKLAIELHKRVIGHEKVEFVKTKLAEAGFQLDKTLSEPEQLFLKRSTHF